MSFVNLLPDDYVERRAQKHANTMCLLLFAAVMVGLLAAAGVSERNHRRTRQVAERVNQSYDEAGKLIRQMQELDVIRHNMLMKANLTAGLLERVPRSYLLAVITNALPEGASLKEFKLTTKRRKTSDGSSAPKSRYEAAAAKHKSSPKGPAKLDVAIIVTGLAGTDVEVGRFIATMDRCGLIEAVDLVYSQEKKVGEAVAREFQVILYLKDGADVCGSPASGEAARRPAAT